LEKKDSQEWGQRGRREGRGQEWEKKNHRLDARFPQKTEEDETGDRETWGGGPNGCAKKGVLKSTVKPRKVCWGKTRKKGVRMRKGNYRENWKARRRLGLGGGRGEGAWKRRKSDNWQDLEILREGSSSSNKVRGKMSGASAWPGGRKTKTGLT